MLNNSLTSRTIFHPLGAVIFTNETYRNTLPLILASGAPILTDYNTYTAYTYGPGGDADKVARASKPNQEQVEQVTEEYNRYVSYWMTVFAPTYSPLRYVVSIIRGSVHMLEYWPDLHVNRTGFLQK